MRRIYLALGKSVIQYCITIWGGVSKTILKPLEISQRSILKVSSFRTYRYPTYHLYQSCEVLTVRQLFVLLTILRQHCLVGFQPCTETRRRATAPNLVRLAFRHVYVGKYFCFLGPYLYAKIHGILSIYNENKKQCHGKIFKFIHKLFYEEPENILNVPQ